ncbi:hypothetical protein [Streptomyces sp. SPB4]|uniref:hypothetical protein n=1 Tax=Streptomyces sp. SPB4 TaxID=2940553 RepID=UPI0024748170|nr:hypothetical protein [Streptomyces sp. SPB4]MDH6545214.1 hypothetical protein [Streptomyces sp. SPB4]
MANDKWTEQERLERVRALLSGSRAQARVGRALAQGGGYGNVLVGVMLHGADRVRQGHTPSDLERMMLDVLKTVMPDTEAREWGRVYRESVTRGQAQLVPAVIRNLPVSQGYTVADLRRDLPHVVSAAVARPDVRVVDPYAAATGQPEDPAFLAAMRESGMGVTASARSSASGAATAGVDGDADGQMPGEPAVADPAAAPEFWVKLELESFYVHREVGDQWWSDDEIYWTAATSAGRNTGKTFHSKEFEDVHKGKTFTFPADNKVLFEGTFKEFLGTTIIAWEADQSSAAWFEELKKALNDALASLRILMTIDSLVPVLPSWVGIAYEIAGMFAVIFDTFRNYDDLSCQRTIGMDRQDLAVLSHYGQTSWHFNGEGHHELKVKYAGEPVPFPVGTLRYAVFNGSTWSAPIALDFESMTPPALASYNGVLHALFVRPADKVVMWSRLEAPVGAGGGTPAWSKPERIGGDASLYAPALAVAHGKLYYAVTGQDRGLYWRTYTTSGGWAPASKFPGYGSEYGPTLATVRDQVWMVHVSGDQSLFLNTHKGTTWGPAQDDVLDWRVGAAVAMVTYNADTWKIAAGLDHRLHASTSQGHPGIWQRQGNVAPDLTNRSPALTVHDGKMWLFIRSTDGALQANTYNGAWSGFQKVSPGTAKPMDAPAAASHDNKLYVMYRE